MGVALDGPVGLASRLLYLVRYVLRVRQLKCFIPTLTSFGPNAERK